MCLAPPSAHRHELQPSSQIPMFATIGYHSQGSGGLHSRDHAASENAVSATHDVQIGPAVARLQVARQLGMPGQAAQSALHHAVKDSVQAANNRCGLQL
jgi:hypothetical protein